jgi:hypothetical protein
MDLVEKYLGEDIDKYQEKICRDAVKNPLKGKFMAPSAEKAEEILRKKFKYTDAQIAKLKK